MEGFKKMNDKLQDLFLDYIRCSAILNHVEKYGTFDEMNVVLGELETLKIKIKEVLDQ